MSMLGEQVKELREAARNIQGKLGRCLYRRKDVDEMQQVSDMLFEAADTIESLRDRLQEEGDALRDYHASQIAAEAERRLHESYGQYPEQVKRENGGECESCESNYQRLFGTPERAARTLAGMDVDACNWCVNSSGNPEDCRSCPYEYNYYGCCLPDGFSLLEWLKQEVDA